MTEANPTPADGPVPFGTRLTRAVAEHGPLCVGNDPHPHLLSLWGLDHTAAGLERCARGMVEACAGQVAIMKPQSAFYEAHGSAGIAVLERVLADARQAGILVLLDVKRGDIGSTMAAYAEAYLGDDAPLRCDAITVSPYLGVGSLQPAFELAARTGRGAFVLARTSNPDGDKLQRADVGGTILAQTVVDEVARLNEHTFGAAGALGSFGLVVGATLERSELDLARLNGPVLAPGLGAQGGTVDGLTTVFGGLRGLLLPSSSRELMAAGPDLAAVRAAVAGANAELRAALATS